MVVDAGEMAILTAERDRRLVPHSSIPEGWDVYCKTVTQLRRATSPVALVPGDCYSTDRRVARRN